MTRYNPDLPHSDVRGVSWDARLRRWQVRFTVDGEYRYFGSYPTQAAAEERALALRGGETHTPRPAGRPSRSGVRGVIWHPQTQRWHVRLRMNGKQRSFGLWVHRLKGHTIIEREATREDGGITHTIGRFGAVVPITLTVCSCGAIW